jgi:cytochrome oxidase Cu insertion factor (SCO1/SenC/PrrC family)
LSEILHQLRGFNSQFQVIELTRSELKKAKNFFGLQFSNPDEEGDVVHKGFTYLMVYREKKWSIKYVYTDGYPEKDQVMRDLAELESSEIN